MRKNAHVLLGTCSCFFMFTMDMVICMFYPRHMHLNPSSKSKFAQVEFFDLLLSRSLAPMSWSQILCFFLHTPLFSISVPLGLGNWTFRMYYIYIQIYIYIIIIYLCPVKVYQTCPGSFYRSHWKTTWYPIEEPCSCLSPRMHVTFWPTFTYVVCINLFGYHMCTYHMYIHDHTCKIR